MITKLIKNSVVKPYPIGRWWYAQKQGTLFNIITCYVADCPAVIKGNTVMVELAPNRVLTETFDHEVTLSDLETLTAKVNHLKSINYANIGY